MATITPRLISSRFISNPDDATQGVKLKVIDGISFIDKRRRNQETQFRLINDPTAGRRVKVVNVGDLSTSTTGDRLLVERILNFSVVDRRSRAQESQFALINAADPLVHYRTHKTKVYATDANGNKDTDTWVEVQRIDQIWVRDPRNRGQDSIFTLAWKDVDDPEWDYTDVPEPTRDWDGTTINPPWRLDPFQNIVDASWGGLYLMALFSGNRVAAIPMSALDAYVGSSGTGGTSATGTTGATGALSVSYAATLVDSTFTDGPIINQIQIGLSGATGSQNIIFSPFKFDDDKVLISDKLTFVDNSLQTIMATSSRKELIPFVCIASSNDKIYTPLDVYLFALTGSTGATAGTGATGGTANITLTRESGTNDSFYTPALQLPDGHSVYSFINDYANMQFANIYEKVRFFDGGDFRYAITDAQWDEWQTKRYSLPVAGGKEATAIQSIIGYSQVSSNLVWSEFYFDESTPEPGGPEPHVSTIPIPYLEIDMSNEHVKFSRLNIDSKLTINQEGCTYRPVPIHESGFSIPSDPTIDPDWAVKVEKEGDYPIDEYEWLRLSTPVTRYSDKTATSDTFGSSYTMAILPSYVATEQSQSKWYYKFNVDYLWVGDFHIYGQFINRWRPDGTSLGGAQNGCGSYTITWPGGSGSINEYPECTNLLISMSFTQTGDIYKQQILTQPGLGAYPANPKWLGFPYAYKGKPWIVIEKNIPITGYEVQSPYGLLDTGVNGDVVPWLNLTNKNHVVQGIGLVGKDWDGNFTDAVDKRRVWCDGVEISDALKFALGVELKDVQGIFLDIPLSKIKSLAATGATGSIG